MYPDPDFHHAAAEWLDGTAGDGSQRLLNDLLHHPEAGAEFAALCRTETLLQLGPHSAKERRAALKRLMAGKPWPQRVIAFCHRPATRWTAAAALLVAGLTWALWTVATPSVEPQSVKKRTPSRVMAAATGDTNTQAVDELAALPPPDKGVERWLRRYYVRPVEMTGPLPEAAAALADAVTMENGQKLTAEVRDSGDAPVHLKLGSALPAWTLLEMLAMQSGTGVVLSGKSVVFRTAARPAPLRGTLTKSAGLLTARSLLALPKHETPADEHIVLSALAHHAFGSRMEFVPAESRVQFAGLPRDVRTFALALSSGPRAPQRIEFVVRRVSLPMNTFDGILDEASGPVNQTATGLHISGAQTQLLLQALASREGVDLLTMPAVTTDPNEPVTVTTNPEGLERQQNEFFATFTGLVSSKGEMNVNASITSESWNEDTKGISTQELSASFTCESGQTCVLGGLISEGREGVNLLTSRIIDTTGIPDESSDEADGPPDELPYGIPIAGRPGFVHSPHANDVSKLVDVTGLPRNAKVKCPFTGKVFKVP